MEVRGGCLCGAVRYRFPEQRPPAPNSTGPVLAAGHCLCTQCRRTSGTAHASLMMMARSGFIVEGQTRAYRSSADSGNTVERCFCPQCGSHVYATNSGRPDHVFLRASSLDDPELFRPEMVVWSRHGPSWAHLDPALPTFPTQPGADVR